MSRRRAYLQKRIYGQPHLRNAELTPVSRSPPERRLEALRWEMGSKRSLWHPERCRGRHGRWSRRRSREGRARLSELPPDLQLRGIRCQAQAAAPDREELGATPREAAMCEAPPSGRL